MPCYPTKNGVLCVGNDPVAITHDGKTYRFEKNFWSGWMPVNLDGSERLTPVLVGAWDKLTAMEEKS